jgi:hypothetical protein
MTKKKWKIAFGLSFIVFIVASCYFVPVWSEITNSTKGPLWGAYLHPFPLSLYISLMIWLGNQAFGSPTGEIRIGWLIGFWICWIPGLIFCLSYVSSALDILGNPVKYWQSPEIGAVLVLLDIPALFFFILQIITAVFAFRRKSDKEYEDLDIFEHKAFECPYCKSSSVFEGLIEGPLDEKEKGSRGYYRKWKCECNDCRKKWYAID